MTDIEVLISNFGTLAGRAGSGGLFIWAIYYFFKNLFGEGGRNPVKIAVAGAVIVGAGAVFKMIPTLLQTGENTGTQMTGNSGGSYSMPSLGKLPADPDTSSNERAAFTPAAITTTSQTRSTFTTLDSPDAAQRAAA